MVSRSWEIWKDILSPYLTRTRFISSQYRSHAIEKQLMKVENFYDYFMKFLFDLGCPPRSKVFNLSVFDSSTCPLLPQKKSEKFYAYLLRYPKQQKPRIEGAFKHLYKVLFFTFPFLRSSFLIKDLISTPHLLINRALSTLQVIIPHLF